MPRITEPTLAEHRAKQRAAILRAAEEIAVERGGAAVTVAAVAARTGLARPSVYAYFDSAQALLVALVTEGFGRWQTALLDALGEATDPEQRVRRYFAAAAASAAQGTHRLAAALTGVPLPPEVRESLLSGHRRTAAPLVEAARDLGVARTETVLPLLLSVLNHCLTRVEAGHAPGPEGALAADFVLGGLRGLAARSDLAHR